MCVLLLLLTLLLTLVAGWGGEFRFGYRFDFHIVVEADPLAFRGGGRVRRVRPDRIRPLDFGESTWKATIDRWVNAGFRAKTRMSNKFDSRRGNAHLEPTTQKEVLFDMFNIRAFFCLIFIELSICVV